MMPARWKPWGNYRVSPWPRRERMGGGEKGARPQLVRKEVGPVLLRAEGARSSRRIDHPRAHPSINIDIAAPASRITQLRLGAKQGENPKD